MADVNVQRLKGLTTSERAALVKRSENDLTSFLAKVQPIIDAVHKEGDAALVRFGRELDKAEHLTKETLKVSNAEFDEAFKIVDPKVIEAIRYGIENIRSFHQEQLPGPMWFKEIRPGSFAGDRYLPINSVALYDDLCSCHRRGGA